MIPTTVLIDDIQVGSGELNYVDVASWGLLPKAENRCTYTGICFDSLCYSSAIMFCYEDKVASWLPGSQQVKVTAPVYIDNEAGGEAQLVYTDTYGMSILVLIALIALALYIMSRSTRR
jgi:hypothetical protein